MPLPLIAILGGLSVGILGSLHCVGMCGPIALAIPLHGYVGIQRYITIFAYNIGRAVTYAILGAMMGMIGASMSFFGWQQKISVISGIIILLLLIKSQWSNYSIPILDTFFSKVKLYMQRFLNPNMGWGGRFALGMLNGLLPCGLVYIALASALAMTSVPQSSIYMFFFGVGTIPAMFSISFFQKPVLAFLRGNGKYIVNIFVMVMAVMLILRGLGLGIPYLSPKLDVSQENTTVDCCHKKK